MNFGLTESDLRYIVNTIKSYGEIDKAVIFGSRAKGTFRRGSDIDIAIYGDKVTFDTVSSLHAKLEEEGPLPYFVDIIDFTHLDHEALKDHIHRVGKVIYEQNA
ncbi:nucleotidyltransferase domain-containing protein [Heliobacterium chlorum]|uniref:Nucleotidyltransferase domain-containing protein n=1 Tax=Heliobacterium chlorum TaxID=2698 RepID=A0ABR7T720_HELCL|nr:nucleotidyltransferase domain-containing protein [Heliobacterium chlorum]MBC9785813.1 nucleotidyltransferase domain-containing protein [Heliobacterium chlorum]